MPGLNLSLGEAQWLMDLLRRNGRDGSPAGPLLDRLATATHEQRIIMQERPQEIVGDAEWYAWEVLA